MTQVKKTTDSKSMIGPGSYIINKRGELQNFNSLTKIEKRDESRNKFEFTHKTCLIIVKSGCVILQGCSFSFEGVVKRKKNQKTVFIYQMPRTISIIDRCIFKGGDEDKERSAGIYLQKCSSLV